jgi:hypothetical protein
MLAFSLLSQLMAAPGINSVIFFTEFGFVKHRYIFRRQVRQNGALWSMGFSMLCA